MSPLAEFKPSAGRIFVKPPSAEFCGLTEFKPNLLLRRPEIYSKAAWGSKYRPIISASTQFYMHFGVYVSSLMALISIHQSFHFKTAHLIFKYFICFCIWRILSSLLLPSQFNTLAMAKTRFVF